MKNPHLLLALSMILMLKGIILPFLMVIHILESTFFLNFFSWGSSVAGLSLGTIWFAVYSKMKKE